MSFSLSNDLEGFTWGSSSTIEALSPSFGPEIFDHDLHHIVSYDDVGSQASLRPEPIAMFGSISDLSNWTFDPEVEEQGPPRKKARSSVLLPVACDSGSQLHELCCKVDSTKAQVQAILHVDKDAASRTHQLSFEKQVYDHIAKKPVTKNVKENYTYPLNLAIKNGAPIQVIECLVAAAPHVLMALDGSMKECPIHVVLKYRPHDTELLDMMLLKNGHSASIVDRHDNTPLHVAVRSGCLLDSVRHLVIMAPRSPTMRNFHGKRALELAQTSSVCSHEVASFLYLKTNDDRLSVP